jgi:hypothetical protein
MERDAKAYDLFRRGLSYRQIGTELGVSHQAAFEAVRRAAKDNAANPLEQAEARQAALDRLQDYRRHVLRVLTGKHYVVSQGGHIVLGPDNKPLIDTDPVLRAVDRLVKIDQEDSRLRDLYPAAKARVEVITEDAVDAELATLARQVAENDARAADTGTG